MIIFEGQFKGWYLIKGIIAFNDENYIKKIAVIYPDRTEYTELPVTKKGLINFVFEIKEKAQKLIICPDEEVKQIKPVRIKKISKLEVLLRMYRRIIPVFFDKNLPNLELIHVLKLNLAKALLKPKETYYQVSYARAKRLCQIISYEEWIENFDNLTDEERKKLSEKANSMNIKVSLLIPWVEDLESVMGTINSIKNQIYKDWELFVCTENEKDYKVLTHLYGDDKRITIILTKKPFDFFIKQAGGNFLGIVFSGDRLSEKALVSMLTNVDEITDVVYSDSDFIVNGKRTDPQFKPGWNYEYLLAYDYIKNLVLFRKTKILEIGGFNQEVGSYVIYDALIRISEKVKRENIKHIPQVLYHSTNAKKIEDWDKYLPYLKEYLNKKACILTVEKGIIPHTFKILYKIPSPPPVVSIIIPTKDKYELLKGCVYSILTKTKYPEYEIIIVDNGSQQKETFEFFNEVSLIDKVRIIRLEMSFNFSKIVNAAVPYAKGSYVVLLNNDTEIISEDWIEGLLSYACIDDVGAVGAKLLYPDGRIQHAGVIVGLHGVADHAFKGLNGNNFGYMYRAVLPQELLAVTAACMMFRREIFEKVGGFDESFSINFNDTDFCLRLIEKGFRVIYNPYVILYHHEHATRGENMWESFMLKQAQKEKIRFVKKWKKYVLSDPFYNPNLNRYRNDFSIGFFNK